MLYSEAMFPCTRARGGMWVAFCNYSRGVLYKNIFDDDDTTYYYCCEEEEEDGD